MGKQIEDLKLIIEKECKIHIKDARIRIRKALEEASLSLMGLTSDYHNSGHMYQVDHCNGRNSVLIDAFREVALEEAKKIAINYKPSSEEIVKASKSFSNKFDTSFRESIKQLAIKRGKEEAEKVISVINIDTKEILLDTKD